MTSTTSLEKKGKKVSMISTGFFWISCCSCLSQTPKPPIFESAPGSPVVMNCGPGNIVASDLNNDSKPDLIIACGQTRTLTIYTGKGGGRFETAARSKLTMREAPNEIVVSDMNNDGKADIVVGSHDSYRVYILKGDGNGDFDTASRSTVIMRNGKDPHTHGLGAADLNHDGLMDLVTANSSDHDVSVMLQNKDGSFIPGPGSPLQVAPAPYPLTIGDVDGDKHPDIVSTTSDRSKQIVTLLLGDGRGNFNRKDIPVRTASPWYVAIADINNDKIADLVMTHTERSELTVLTGNKNREFTEVNGSPFDLGHSAWHVAIADVNGDKFTDVLAAADNGVRVMLGNGKGLFTHAPGSPLLTGKGTWHLGLADFNADGRPDIVTSNLESKNVSVLLAR